MVLAAVPFRPIEDEVPLFATCIAAVDASIPIPENAQPGVIRLFDENILLEI